MTSPQEPDTRPITINITDHATEVRAGTPWTDAQGDTHGSLSFGASWLVCHTPQQARDIAAEAAKLAGEMEAEAARAAEAAEPARDGGQP